MSPRWTRLTTAGGSVVDFHPCRSGSERLAASGVVPTPGVRRSPPCGSERRTARAPNALTADDQRLAWVTPRRASQPIGTPVVDGYPRPAGEGEALIALGPWEAAKGSLGPDGR